MSPSCWWSQHPGRHILKNQSPRNLPDTAGFPEWCRPGGITTHSGSMMGLQLRGKGHITRIGENMVRAHCPLDIIRESFETKTTFACMALSSIWPGRKTASQLSEAIHRLAMCYPKANRSERPCDCTPSVSLSWSTPNQTFSRHFLHLQARRGTTQ